MRQSLTVLCRAAGLKTPAMEYRFCLDRKWRFDYAWPDQRIALEYEGGVTSGGRHTRAVGYTKDCEKYNQAQIMGWTVLRVTNLTQDSEVINTLKAAAAKGAKVAGKKLQFSRNFTKLYESLYSTLRHNLVAAKYAAGDLVTVYLNDEKHHLAFITGVSLKPLREIEIEVLMKDAAYKGFEIRTHEQYLDLLRELYPDKEFKSIDDYVTLIILSKVNA